MEIQLTQGKVALVDEEDKDLAEKKWCATLGNRTTTGDLYYAVKGSWDRIKHRQNNLTYLHKIVLSRKLNRKLSVTEQCDHINGNSLDNRRENLRLCTQSENNMNQRIQERRSKTSRFKGVSWHKDRKIWRAVIKKDRKYMHIGVYDNEEEAAIAYDSRAIKEFGIYARTNKMLGRL